MADCFYWEQGKDTKVWVIAPAFFIVPLLPGSKPGRPRPLLLVPCGPRWVREGDPSSVNRSPPPAAPLAGLHCWIKAVKM